jgi:L-threonylcarbamoyladenylate synthase
MKHLQFRIQQGVDHLIQGSVIAYPTEAVWGLGCDPNQPAAVAKLLRMKRRDPRQGLILVAATIHQFAPYLQNLSSQQYEQLQASWPAPLTWLVPDDGVAPRYVKGNFDTIALRVSDHPVVRDLCLAFEGPIVSTSANPHGMKPAKDPFKVRCYFGDALDYLVPGSLSGSDRPTEIRELSTGIVRRNG